jgi:hypothetical protein
VQLNPRARLQALLAPAAAVQSPANYFENQANVFGTINSMNMLCVHGSVKASISGLKEVTE